MPDTADPVAAYLAELNERTALRQQSDEITRRLLAAVEAVLARHQPGDGTVEIHTLNRGWHRVTACAGCEDAWPCSDYEAISANLLGGTGGDDAAASTVPVPPKGSPRTRVTVTPSQVDAARLLAEHGGRGEHGQAVERIAGAAPEGQL